MSPDPNFRFLPTLRQWLLALVEGVHVSGAVEDADYVPRTYPGCRRAAVRERSTVCHRALRHPANCAGRAVGRESRRFCDTGRNAPNAWLSGAHTRLISSLHTDSKFSKVVSSAFGRVGYCATKKLQC